MLIQRARDNLAAVAFCNLVGGQDELVFDGHSLLIDHEGTVLARAPQFARGADRRDRRPAGGDDRPAARHAAAQAGAPRAARGAPARAAGAPRGHRRRPAGGDVAPLLEPEAEVYAALVLGTRDYVAKNGFQHVVIGLSGGIDSTLTLLIAVDALGPDRVTCVTMPSRYSSSGTRDDAKVLADNLGVELLELADRPGDGGLRRAAGRAVRGPRARHHRGEPAGADPRQPADGAVEQVRLARAHDRQQVRELGRLLDAVRRLGRRLRGHQGRAEDARLPARGLPQRARRRASRAALDHRPPAERRAARRPARRRLAAATTTRSTRSSRPTSRRTPTPISSSGRATRARRSRR